MDLNSIQDIKDILRGKIFVSGNSISYVFEEEAFAKLDGDMRLLIRRDNIEWKKISPKHRYSIAQQRQNFIFNTHENEISASENEFILSMTRKYDDTYTVILLSSQDGKECLRLYSD